MIFQPAIITLLLASATGALLLAACAPYALRVLRSWDLASGAEYQLRLERRTYLVSTIVAFVLAAQVLALLLFVFNADRMALMFVGAMCAVGTLNANAFGFPALLTQIAVFFLACTWLILNHLDTRAEDYPLMRVKYGFLLAIMPVLALAGWLQLRYFLGLKADVITSCCGSLFSEGTALAGDLAGFPPGPAMLALYGTLAATLAVGAACLKTGRGAPVYAAASVIAFTVSLAGIVSFLSLYAYEHPHHHCPFCLLKPEYGYQGYALYAPLFGAATAGLGAGAVAPFAKVASLVQRAPALARRLVAVSMALFAAFAAVASLIILRSNLVLLDGHPPL
jgi:hypothetical protein